jgi:hypothetical protein
MISLTPFTKHTLDPDFAASREMCRVTRESFALWRRDRARWRVMVLFAGGKSLRVLSSPPRMRPRVTLERSQPL